MDTTNNQLIVPYSSSPPSWDVFLSFYGKDTRNNFIAHLYFSLDQAGILTFRDDPALEKGEEISSGLLKAIKDSKMFVVVLSENYARSPWCLNELVEILSCRRTEHQVIPVFYHVDPSDLRHHKGTFGEALDFHKKRYSVDTIEKWKSALVEIAELSGYHFKKDANENESDILQEIVENVAAQTSTRALHLEEYLVGMNSAVEEVYRKLRMELNDVRAIGICGMGGIGKTTIAKSFYNKYSNKFDISCFIENIKQYSQGGTPLLSVLEQLLVGLLKRKDYTVRTVESGIRQLDQILSSKKALIVLDDLHESLYLDLFVRLRNMFNAGSRIIITTRDANLITQLSVDMPEVDLYMVKELGEIDSFKLFSYHAFRKPMPPESFRELSVRFIGYAGGVPLAIKVLGSSLCGRTQVSFWNAKLEKVRKIPNKEIQEILQLSYDELDETEKATFLDLAFFFVGKDRDEAVHIFHSCDYFPDAGIPILVERCLVTIDKDNKFRMHNLIQDMGLGCELGKSRGLFWRGAPEDMQNLEAPYKIEGLILDLTKCMKRQITAEIFDKLSNLRLLEIIGVRDIEGHFKNLFQELRCIQWHGCPWLYLSPSFNPQKLVSLYMPNSKLKMLWKRPMPSKQLSNLCHLELRNCPNLKQLPDQLGDMKALKMIDASGTAIEKLPDSIVDLKRLDKLKLNECYMLKMLPKHFGSMESLRTFDASQSALRKLPVSFGALNNLVELNMTSCHDLRKLPYSFGRLINLEHLRLYGCVNLSSLPHSIWKLKSLRVLNMELCFRLERLPKHLGKMQCLEELNAHFTGSKELPDSIGLLSKLKVLAVNGFDITTLEYVPSSIWNLKSLTKLNLVQQENDPTITLASPKLMIASENGTIDLHDAVKDMKLKELSVRCNMRSWLPLIQNFSSLEVLYIVDDGQSISLTEPLDFSKLEHLEDLTLLDCTSIGSSILEIPLNLKYLRLFNYTTLKQLPDLSSMKRLKILKIERCMSLQSLQQLPPHLEELIVDECESLQDVPELSMLKELRRLSFSRCSNMKSINLKETSLVVGRIYTFDAALPNREVAEWFSYKSRSAVTFDIPLSVGDNFFGVALWVVYKCISTDVSAVLTAVITNETKGIKRHRTMGAPTDVTVGEVQSLIKCVRGENISLESGHRVSVLFLDNDGIAEVESCGVHVIQNTPLATAEQFFPSLPDRLNRLKYHDRCKPRFSFKIK